MPNTFITPTVVARVGIATLYNTIVLAALVWRDFDEDFTGTQGDTVTVRKPAVFTAEEFNEAAGITLQDATEGSTTISLDKIANVSFTVTDKQRTLNVSDFREQLLKPAMEAIAQKVDGDIAEMLIDAAEGAGGGGTVNQPSVADPVGAFRGARRVINRNLLPVSERYAVLSPEAESVVLGQDLVIAVDKSGATQALREGVIGRIVGFETYMSQVLGRGPGDRGQGDGVAFHRSAGVLATRNLELPKGVGEGQAERSNYKGLSLRVVYAYDLNKKKDNCSVDMLYGVKATRPEAAVQLDYGQGS